MVTNRGKLTQIYTFFSRNFDTFFLEFFLYFLGKIQSGSTDNSEE